MPMPIDDTEKARSEEERTIKICHMTSVHKYDERRIFERECLSLARAGFEVHIVAHEAPQGEQDGVHVHNLDLIQAPYGEWRRKTAQAFLEKAVWINADMYQFHNAELLEVGLALRKFNKVIVYDVAEDFRQVLGGAEGSNNFFQRLVNESYIMKETKEARQMDMIVGSSPHIGERYHHLGCLCLDICDYPTLAELRSKKMDFSKKEKAVCYIGTLSRTLGLFEMIDAVEKADCKLLLGGEFVSRKEKEYAMSLPGWKRVEHQEALKSDKIKEFLDRSIAGLVLFHPYGEKMQSEPNQFGDYFSAGIPVIASDFPLWKEVIEEHNCGFCVEALDVEAVAAAIQLITHQVPQAQEMGERGVRIAIEKYNWEIEKHKLIRTYRKLMT